MTEPQKRAGKHLRCAIYTRKSSDEGLEQAFNSLDAQREACVAYIQSQKHEGWIASAHLYDDGGYSGGTLDRPALKRLLVDIAAGKVDVVVVYKIDRLTRSLFDFAKIVEAFDARSVSFVSITQQFNTTTSMGRLTLNVLLSFAQFEREIAGERIRDKIAASKKKGMWMGGLPPLGYDVRERKLEINEDEAKAVRHIFERYVQLRSVRVLQAELAVMGIRSKPRSRVDGSSAGSQKLSRGALYLMLQNRLYRGEITHRGSAYPGQHQAIINQVLWDQVQAILGENRVDRTVGANARSPSLLAGLAFDESGERLTPTHAVKKGTRYRYYISKSLIINGAKDRDHGMRIPAANLEGLVLDRLKVLLETDSAILDAMHDHEMAGGEQRRFTVRARQLAEDLVMQDPAQVRELLLALVDRIRVSPNRIDIVVNRRQLLVLLRTEPNSPLPARLEGDNAVEPLALTVEASLRRVGREMKLIVNNGDRHADPDPGLLRIVARAHDIYNRLLHDPGLSTPTIARKEGVTISYLSRLLRLATLAPDITTAIMNGKQPPQLSAKKLMRMSLKLPAEWASQRKMLGFAQQ